MIFSTAAEKHKKQQREEIKRLNQYAIAIFLSYKKTQTFDVDFWVCLMDRACVHDG